MALVSFWSKSNFLYYYLQFPIFLNLSIKVFSLFLFSRLVLSSGKKLFNFYSFFSGFPQIKYFFSLHFVNKGSSLTIFKIKNDQLSFTKRLTFSKKIVFQNNRFVFRFFFVVFKTKRSFFKTVKTIHPYICALLQRFFYVT